MIELLQRIGQRLIIICTVAEEVDGSIDGMTQRGWVGDALSGNIKGGTVIGRGDDKGEARLGLDAILRSQGLERHITLIVVHRQDTVEVVLIGITEEVIGDKGTVGLYTSLLKRRNGWGNDVLLWGFRASTAMRGF